MKKICAWLLSVLAAAGAALAFVLRSKPNAPMVEQELERSKRTVEDIEDRQADRAKRKERLDKRFITHLCLALLLTVPFTASAKDLSYEELLANYKEVVQIAQEYKLLYEEVESDLNVMVEQTKRLQQLVTEQQAIIKSLLGRKLSVSAGVTYHLDSGLGVAALATYHF